MTGAKLQVVTEPDGHSIFELYETLVAEVTGDMQRLLFCLAGRCMRNEGEERRSGGFPKRPRTDFSKTSAINPGSRRRKPATGLTYD